jgi:hypothetical protein
MADPKGALSTLDPNASTATDTVDKNILDTDGGLASIAVKSSVPKQGQLATLSSKDAGALDPSNSKAILESMQKLIEQKEAQQNSLLTALNLASAYGSGGTEGPQRQVQAQMAQSSANENDIYNMRLQKAQLQGQQANAQTLMSGLTAPIGGAPAGGGAPSGMAPSGGGAPTTGAPANTLQQIISQLPPDQQAMAKVLITQPGGVQKVMEMARVHSNIVSKENIGAQNKPEYYEKKIEIRVVGANGKEKIELVSLDDLKKNPNLGKITPQGSQTVEQMSSGTTAPPPVTPSTDVAFGAKVPLEKLYSAFYAQESGSGKADTTKFNEFGVMGPMQIKKETFAGYQAKGVIPKEYRIDNPEDNLKAGKLILEDLYKQYGGDIEKVAAAYYGGPKVINKDGTIDLSVKPIRTNPATGKPYDVNDPKRPKDPTVGEYIDQIKKRIEGEPVVKKPVESRTIPEMRSESELNKEREKALIASDTKKREEFEASTKPMDLERARAQTLRASELLKTNPNISGVLSEPGIKNAILQFVNNRMPRADLESVLFKALAPSIKDENDRRELISYLAENEIRGRGLIKGTGAISDYEQGILSKIAGSISDPAEVLYKRFRVFDKSNEYNIAARKLWDANDFKSMREFENDPRHKALLKAYVADINNVYNEKVDFTAARNQSAKPDIKYPNDPEKQKRWEEFKKGKQQ